MPVCKIKDININYMTYGTGIPLVLIHPFSSSLEFWSSLIQDLPPKYRVIAYDVRGHGLSSAPCGVENYTLDVLVEDLHNLLLHLKVKEAIIGGLSLGGAIALGYSHRHPEVVKTLLICDIHGSFQPRPWGNYQSEMTRLQTDDENYARKYGMADLARLRIAAKRVLLQNPEDIGQQELYIGQMAKFSFNGLCGVGQSKPWDAEWQQDAADKITVPTLITVGEKDLIKPGVKILHKHIKGSRYVEIEGSVHGTAQWRPQSFNRCVLEFLDTVEQGLPVQGEIFLDRTGKEISSSNSVNKKIKPD